ncbi:MAG: ComF family protein [Patescibacteria group bacterium]|nr:ComF family protein [Patescibacteria group bacterium]
MQYFTALKNILLDLFFPQSCLNCGALIGAGDANPHLCAACAASIRPLTTFFCPSCKARIPDARKMCHQSVPYILAACVAYDEPVKPLIHQLKYRGWTSVADTLRPFLAVTLRSLPLSTENLVVVPVPLHPARKRERGFNQAELIARNVADILSLPIDAGALVRIKKTKSQAELRDRSARRQNVADAFAVHDGHGLAGKNVLLVDDVFTSGATMTDAVRALRAAGAKKIVAFTVAKA